MSHLSIDIQKNFNNTLKLKSFCTTLIGFSDWMSSFNWITSRNEWELNIVSTIKNLMTNINKKLQKKEYNAWKIIILHIKKINKTYACKNISELNKYVVTEIQAFVKKIGV